MLGETKKRNQHLLAQVFVQLKILHDDRYMCAIPIHILDYFFVHIYGCYHAGSTGYILKVN